MAVLRFGVFELDEASGDLSRGGRRVHLPAQPARVLALLAARPGDVVTRDELRAHLWGETHVEFDQGLAFCLARIRVALGDSARAPRFVETLPRRGYRFLASVERVAPRSAAPPPPVALPAEPVRAPRQPRTVLAAVTLALTLQGAMPPVVPHTRDTAAPRAQELFARGQAESGRGAAGQRRSIASFREAAQADPRFAEAHDALAHVYLALSESGQLQPAVALREAERAARTALALEDVPATRLVLAASRWFGAWDWDAARAEVDRAQADAPDSAAVHRLRARLLSASGDDAGAIAAIDRAEALMPDCEALASESGQIRLRARRYADAVLKLRQAIALGPPRGEDAVAWQQANLLHVLRAHAGAGAWPDAQQDAAALLALVGVDAEKRAAFLRQDPRASVLRFLSGSARYLENRAQEQYLPRVEIARLHALHGDVEAALALLLKAAEDREPALARSLRDPDFDALRSDARFAELAGRVGPAPTVVRIASAR